MTGSPVSQADAHSAAFIAALEGRDLAGVRQAPKAESHTHGPYGGDRDWLAAATGRDIAPVDRPLGSMDAMHAWTAVHIGDLFAGRESRRRGWEGAFVRAARDGLAQVDFGDDVWMITQGLGDAARLFADIEAARTAICPQMDWTPSWAFPATAGPNGWSAGWRPSWRPEAGGPWTCRGTSWPSLSRSSRPSTGPAGTGGCA